MDYKIDGKDILLKQNDFALDDTLDCGQAFRWKENEDGSFTGVAFGRLVTSSHVADPLDFS